MSLECALVCQTRRPGRETEKSKTQPSRQLATVCSRVLCTVLESDAHQTGWIRPHCWWWKPRIYRRQASLGGQPFLSEGFKFSMSWKQKSQSSAACSHDWTWKHTAHFFHHNLNRKSITRVLAAGVAYWSNASSSGPCRLRPAQCFLSWKFHRLLRQCLGPPEPPGQLRPCIPCTQWTIKTWHFIFDYNFG